jgi:hypothetical protein
MAGRMARMSTTLKTSLTVYSLALTNASEMITWTNANSNISDRHKRNV